LGSRLNNVGDDRGIVLVEKAMKLDPLHPTWFYRPIADHHFERGEYKEALAAARKIDVPGHYWPHVYLAAIYAELDCTVEAKAAVDKLHELSPELGIKKISEEWKKWNYQDRAIRRWASALRKAGLGE
jgi:adenylate cyclase